MKYPAWWKEGARVIGRDGSTGILSVDGMGQWRVNFDYGEANGQKIVGFLPGPRIEDWTQKPNLVLDKYQIRAVCFEADRAFLRALGRGNTGQDFMSIPDAARMGAAQPYVHPLEGDGFAAVRVAITAAVSKVLAQYVPE